MAFRQVPAAELLARLSLLVAPPRYPLVRYGGLFAPAHGLRKAIVARAPGPPGEERCRRAREGSEAKEAKAGKEATAATPERTPGPSATRADAGLANVLLAGEAEAGSTDSAVGPKGGELLGAATPKPWLDGATLLRRMYDLDVLACPCGGRLRFVFSLAPPGLGRAGRWPVSDSIDTRTASGRLVLNLLTSVAQWEREATGERTRDALAHLKAEGVLVGGLPLGVRRTGVVDRDGRQVVEHDLPRRRPSDGSESFAPRADRCVRSSLRFGKAGTRRSGAALGRPRR